MRSAEVFNPKSASSNFKYPITRINRWTVGLVVSSFYEALNQSIFGGVQGYHHLQTGRHPDTTDEQRGRYIEVKATSHSRRVMLKDEQVGKDAILQISDNPIVEPHLYEAIYRYGSRRGICRDFRNMFSGKFIRFLENNTRFLIGLDFPIIYQCHSLGFQGHRLLSRRFGKGTPATHFSSTLIDLFFSNPEQALGEIGLNAEYYRIQHRRLAEGLTLNGHEVKPFPMVLIKSNPDTHARFIEELRKQ